MWSFLKSVTVSSLLAVTGAKLHNEYPEPPEILQPNTNWYGTYGNSRVGKITAPFTDPTDGQQDYVNAYRLDLVGNTVERGEAFGSLMYQEIIKFATYELDKYYMKAILDIDVSQYPEPLQKIFHIIQIKGAKAAPEAVNNALEWVYEQEEKYMPAYLIEEMEAIGKGVCLGMTADHPHEECNVEEMTNMVKRVNMLPELIRMACTAYGAWGSATPNGKLTQIRALDFGGGPFSNYTIIAVYRSAPDAAEQERAFATVMFPGMVGVITGVSDKGVGISEKVWMTYDTPSLQPGSYDGEPDVFVLRDLLQLAGDRKEAEKHLDEVKRTFAIWIGVGDYSTQQMDIVGYLEEAATPYTDVTMPTMTEQPYIESVVYVDKHPQPSHDGATGTLPVGLQDFWGNLTMANSRMILQSHQTGDQHIAMYDFGNEQMMVSIGRINSEGEYGPIDGDTKSWMAYNRPYLLFNLQDLWTGAV